jgi:hypothetical protein
VHVIFLQSAPFMLPRPLLHAALPGEREETCVRVETLRVLPHLGRGSRCRSLPPGFPTERALHVHCVGDRLHSGGSPRLESIYAESSLLEPRPLLELIVGDFEPGASSEHLIITVVTIAVSVRRSRNIVSITAGESSHP